MRIKLFLFITLFLSYPINSFSNEVIILKNGNQIKTNYIWKTQGKINCFSEGKEYSFDTDDVREIIKEKIVNLKQQDYNNSYKSSSVQTEVISRENNPISSIPRAKAMEDIKRSLAERYSGSYSTQKMLLDNNMQAYDRLSRLPPTNINNKILSGLKNRYYPSFSTISMLYDNNIKAYNDLNNN